MPFKQHMIIKNPAKKYIQVLKKQVISNILNLISTNQEAEK